MSQDRADDRAQERPREPGRSRLDSAHGDAPASSRDAWIRTLGVAEASASAPRLLAAYRALRGKGSARPAAYSTPTGEPPNIIRCHSLDPEAMEHAFGVSAAVHWGEHSLPWPLRETINTVTSRLNNCFY